MNTKNLLYSLLCISFTTIIGAAIFEHLVIWPTAFAAPPASLAMFQGEYGVDVGNFWRLIHPITLILFIISLVLSWKTERRLHVLIPFATYVIIIVITFSYFLPEMFNIAGTTYSDQIDENLISKGQTWQIMSFIRLIVIIGMALFMYLGLTKSLSQSTK